MEKLNLLQGSQEWLELRKSKITSTDMAAILSQSPFVSALDLWKEKVGLKEPPFVSPAMRRGQEHEDDARILANADLGRYFDPCVIVSLHCPWLMASLDGLAEDKAFIEIKTPVIHNYEKAIKEEIPRHYFIQMQTVFTVGDGKIEKGFYCVYSPEKYEINIREIFPDKNLIEQIKSQSKEFLRRIREFDAPQGLHRCVTSEKLAIAVDKYRIAKDMALRAARMLKEAEEEIKEISSGENIAGSGVKVTHFWRRGPIDYAKIPELQNVDLEKYRKEASELCKISLVSNS